jgi:hypothetical protein
MGRFFITVAIIAVICLVIILVTGVLVIRFLLELFEGSGGQEIVSEGGSHR